MHSLGRQACRQPARARRLLRSLQRVRKRDREAVRALTLPPESPRPRGCLDPNVRHERGDGTHHSDGASPQMHPTMRRRQPGARTASNGRSAATREPRARSCPPLPARGPWCPGGLTPPASPLPPAAAPALPAPAPAPAPAVPIPRASPSSTPPAVADRGRMGEDSLRTLEGAHDGNWPLDEHRCPGCCAKVYSRMCGRGATPNTGWMERNGRAQQGREPS